VAFSRQILCALAVGIRQLLGIDDAAVFLLLHAALFLQDGLLGEGFDLDPLQDCPLRLLFETAKAVVAVCAQTLFAIPHRVFGNDLLVARFDSHDIVYRHPCLLEFLAGVVFAMDCESGLCSLCEGYNSFSFPPVVLRGTSLDEGFHRTRFEIGCDSS